VPEVRAPRRNGIRSTRGHRLHIEKTPPWNRIDLGRDALHRHFWRRRGERDRLPINIGELADSLGVSYDTANAVVIAMRDEGRLRAVAWKKVRIRIYQVADPEQWNARDRSTHAARASEPVWG
jgi:hypothetical protein